jgi:hypothetical protein
MHFGTIKIVDFFEAINTVPYVAIKLNEIFPQYYSGSDIDILCYNASSVASKIIPLAKKYTLEGFELKCTEKTKSHLHIDLIKGDKIDFRFDIHESIPEYKNIIIKNSYIYSIIENRKNRTIRSDNHDFNIYIPSEIDELILRYIEYIEWFRIRTDKIKHLEYIADRIQENPQDIGFIDKLHCYIQLPSESYTQKITNRFYLFRWFNFYFLRAKELGISNIFKSLKKKFLKK